MKKKVVLVASAPAPYREPVHQRVSDLLRDDYHVIYAHQREPNRLWDLKQGAYSRSFLKKSFISWRGRFIHVNFDVWFKLDRLSPEIVITTGFNPTYLLSFLWSRWKGKKHIAFVDGWLKSEESLSWIHFRARKSVYHRSTAFIGVGNNNLDMYRHYGCAENTLFLSPLCADNGEYAKFLGAEKKYDLVFSGQMIGRKMPLFFAKVAVMLRERKPDLKVLLLGDGPDREAMQNILRSGNVNFHYAGFVKQSELPAHYVSAKIFLFPTMLEPWGVVANEAMAAGLPVITCPNAGAAGDLVVHGQNGFVLELDPRIWCEHALKLLDNDDLRAEFSRRALEKVREFNYETAADGIVKAINFAMADKR